MTGLQQLLVNNDMTEVEFTQQVANDITIQWLAGTMTDFFPATSVAAEQFYNLANQSRSGQYLAVSPAIVTPSKLANKVNDAGHS